MCQTAEKESESEVITTKTTIQTTSHIHIVLNQHNIVYLPAGCFPETDSNTFINYLDLFVI